MKKITFFAIAALLSVVAFAQKPFFVPVSQQALQDKVVSTGITKPERTTSTTGQARRVAPRRAQSDYVVITEQPAGELKTFTRSGSYLYAENQNLYIGNQSGEVSIVFGENNEIYIKDPLMNYAYGSWVSGTYDAEAGKVTIPVPQNLLYVEQYDACIAMVPILGYQATDFTAQDITYTVTQSDGNMVLTLDGFTDYNKTLGAGWTDDNTIQVYGEYNTVFTEGEYAPPTPVEIPEGVEVFQYVLTHDGGSIPVYVAVDGNDIYFQGLSEYLPESWVKGTKDGDQVTFAAKQYMGEYGSYGSSYFFYNGETVFTYDAEADTYSAEGQVFGVLADKYYDGNYTNPVIGPVVEKAATPANPAIESLKESDYGWYINFNVPVVDVDGSPLVVDKLSYMFYTDVEGEIQPLTFTPETHSRLTENMVEIPYTFSDDYDIYNSQIYLNDLYSADWNKIGIQSIYTGGDETNASEIQWYEIKPYKVTAHTFNFNTMDVPTSSSVINDGDITEDTDFTADNVTLTISPKAESATTPNRFWSTANGPQLRVYSGTLTFSVPTGYVITNIVFNYGRWGANTVEEVEIPNDAEAKTATWTGMSQKVVVNIAANTQINSITVTTETFEVGPVEAPADLATEVYEFRAFALEYNQDGDIEHPDYVTMVNVGFDGEDAYIQGLATDAPELWVKATKNKEGKYVIPANQYMGDLSFYGYTFPYYWTAVDESGALADAVLDFDPETNTFTTDQILALNGAEDALDYYMLYSDVIISKFEEVAATPAAPTFEKFKISDRVGYSTIYASIPAVGTEGEALNPEKLFYTVWIEKDGQRQPYVFSAELYSQDFEADVTEVPYNHGGYDVFKGGEIIYLEDELEELASWTNVGIQSIYYGAGERRESEIQWAYVLDENEGYAATYGVSPFQTVNMKYSLKAGWNTIVLPFAVEDLTAFGEGAKAYELTDAVDGVLSVNTVTELAANTPYIIYAPEAKASLSFDIWEFVEPTELNVEKNGVTFQGTYEPVAAPGMQGKYGVTNEGSILKGTANASIKGFRAYFEAAPGTNIKAISFDGGEATGIEEIANGEWLNAKTYNLAGQRIQKAQKGVNIVNGKKVLY